MSKYTKEQIKNAVEISKSFSDACRKLGAKDWGGSYCNIRGRILRYGFDTSHFDKSFHCRGQISNNRKSSSEYLVYEERTHRQDSSLLMRSLIEIGREYKCESCCNSGQWNGKILPLEIDHINCNWKDNRPENLRFLCPNCHTQITRANFIVPSVDKKTRKDKGSKKPRESKINLSKEELEKLLWEMPTTHIAKRYNVSDKAIEKLAKKWILNKPRRGYWTKK